MVGIEKILFLALKVKNPWKIQIEFENGTGEITVRNRNIIHSKLEFSGKISEGEEAFIKILQNQNKIKKIDIFPLSKVQEKENIHYDIHKIMETVEKLAIEKSETSENWIDEFLINLLSLDSNWIVNLQGTTFKGKLYLFNRQYVDAFFIDKITKEKETGEKAFEKIIKNKDKIETAELLPLKEQPNIQFNKGFMELLNTLD